MPLAFLITMLSGTKFRGLVYWKQPRNQELSSSSYLFGSTPNSLRVYLLSPFLFSFSSTCALVTAVVQYTIQGCIAHYTVPGCLRKRTHTSYVCSIQTWLRISSMQLINGINFLQIKIILMKIKISRKYGGGLLRSAFRATHMRVTSWLNISQMNFRHFALLHPPPCSMWPFRRQVATMQHPMAENLSTCRVQNTLTTVHSL